MLEHPQFIYDRYAQEMQRIDERNERIRAINERREADAEGQPESHRRGWFHWRRAARVETMQVAPVVPAGIDSPQSAIWR